MSTLYTKREAALALGIDRNTLTKWARECGITGGEDPRDKRLSLLSDEDLRTIRERYADRHTFSTSAADFQRTHRTSSSDLAARVAALEATIEQLRQHAGWLFTASTEARVMTDVQLPPYEPPRRQMVTTARYSHTPAYPPIPAGMMSLPTWVKLHAHLGVKQGTVESWRDVGKLPMERGQWMEDKTRIGYIMDAEGRMVAHQLAHLPWPCERCLLEEGEGEAADNETPHSVAVE